MSKVPPVPPVTQFPATTPPAPTGSSVTPMSSVMAAKQRLQQAIDSHKRSQALDKLALMMKGSILITLPSSCKQFSTDAGDAYVQQLMRTSLAKIFSDESRRILLEADAISKTVIPDGFTTPIVTPGGGPVAA